MRSFITSHGRRLYVGLGVAIVAAFSVVGPASAAVTYDLSGVSTPFTDQLSNAVTTALPIGGALMALFVGWKVVKRLTRG